MELTGLTNRQAQLADILWRINSLEAVEEFIAKLPTPEFRRDANLVKELMVLSAIDDVSKESNLTDANEALAFYTKKYK